jgi:hypothetical protein
MVMKALDVLLVAICVTKALPVTKSPEAWNGTLKLRPAQRLAVLGFPVLMVGILTVTMALPMGVPSPHALDTEVTT